MVFWYQHLSAYLDGNVSVYAIQDPEISDNSIHFSSIHHLAEHYLKLIKTVHNSGSYYIGGASFGATVALEIIHQLNSEENQYANATLLSFDGWAIYPDGLTDMAYFRRSMQRQQDDWKVKFDSRLDNTSFEGLFAIQKKRLDLLYRYKAKNINGPIFLYKSKEIMPIFEEVNSQYNYWDNLSNKVALRIVDGSHETMFDKVNAEKLADLVYQDIISTAW